MKVYFFYLKEEAFLRRSKETVFDFVSGFGNGDIVQLDGENCILYACTNVKEYAIEFSRLRALDNFILIKDKMSKEEYKAFIKSHDACELSLERYWICNMEVYLALTEYEVYTYESMLETSTDDLIELQDCAYIIDTTLPYFKKKYKEYLYKTSIVNHVAWLADFSYCHTNTNEIPDKYCDMEINPIKILQDLFGFTMY